MTGINRVDELVARSRRLLEADGYALRGAVRYNERWPSRDMDGLIADAYETVRAHAPAMNEAGYYCLTHRVTDAKYRELCVRLVRDSTLWRSPA